MIFFTGLAQLVAKQISALHKPLSPPFFTECLVQLVFQVARGKPSHLLCIVRAQCTFLQLCSDRDRWEKSEKEEQRNGERMKERKKQPQGVSALCGCSP